MGDKLGYAILEIGGIQKYILATGKLKEMIGGSQLVEEMSKKFFEDTCKELDPSFEIIPGEKPKCPSSYEILALQRNAGVLHLLFSSVNEAKEFIYHFGKRMLEKYTGVPLFSGVAQCSWDKDSFRVAREEAGRHLNISRSTNSVPSGLNMLPICISSPLDGFPAVDYDRTGDGDKKPVSALSISRSSPSLIERSNNRLKLLISDLSKGELDFEDNLEKMIGDSKSDVKNKIAFIHMDGNDLGKLFMEHFEEQDKEKTTLSLSDALVSNYTLSQTVSESSEVAMKAALEATIKFEQEYIYPKKANKSKLIVPVRPLVLGGDDVTVIVRADLALLFINTFINKFESVSQQKFKEQGKQGHLTMGVGMVVCNSHYPFVRAFDMSEELLDIAKKKTAHDPDRKSSMDYVVITNEIENDIDVHHSNVLIAHDGKHLSKKPLILDGNELHDFVEKADIVLSKLPRSSIRPAINECRKGEKASQKIWDQILYKLNYGFGGRNNNVRMTATEFKKVFPSGFFEENEKDNSRYTALGDYIELYHLLPEKQFRKSYIEQLKGGAENNETSYKD